MLRLKCCAQNVALKMSRLNCFAQNVALKMTGALLLWIKKIATKPQSLIEKCMQNFNTIELYGRIWSKTLSSSKSHNSTKKFFNKIFFSDSVKGRLKLSNKKRNIKFRQKMSLLEPKNKKNPNFQLWHWMTKLKIGGKQKNF